MKNKIGLEKFQINSRFSLTKALFRMNKYGFKSLIVVDDNKKYLWKKALEQMPKAFTTNDWVEEVVNDLNMVKERQAKKWLREIELLGMIKKIKHGHWEKTSLEFVEDINELE